MVWVKSCGRGFPKRLPGYQVIISVCVALFVLTSPAISLADSFMATGTYSGNGESTQSISGLGFQPDLVIVKSVEAKHSHIRTTNMPAGN